MHYENKNIQTQNKWYKKHVPKKKDFTKRKQQSNLTRILLPRSHFLKTFQYLVNKSCNFHYFKMHVSLIYFKLHKIIFKNNAFLQEYI